MASLPSKRSGLFSKKNLLWALYLIVLTPFCLELGLRILSAKPYIQTDYHIEIDPPQAFIGSDSLGIILNPGSYTIRLNNKVEFQTTHTQNKQRNVPDSSAVVDRPEIAMMGCSFTYGYGVDDDETFTSILQQKYPQWHFSNHGVIGYGSLQSYFQLQEMIKKNEIPDAVILHFATDHFERNALSKKFRRAMKIGFDRSLSTAQEMMKDARFPFLERPSDSIGFESWPELYSDWSWRDKLSAVNWIQTQSDLFSDRSRELPEISAKSITMIDALCRDNDIAFKVVLLDRNKHSSSLEGLLKEKGISFLNAEFDFTGTEHTNLPDDLHPNEAGHAYLANKIEHGILNTLFDE